MLLVAPCVLRNNLGECVKTPLDRVLCCFPAVAHCHQIYSLGGLHRHYYGEGECRGCSAAALLLFELS